MILTLTLIPTPDGPTLTHPIFKEAVPAMEIYTFGQPRVGNPAFRSAFNQLTSQQQPGAAAFRVVHWRDPIPLAPFQWMGYEHTATEVCAWM